MHPGRGIAATIGDIDGASDEQDLRAGVDRARREVAAELTAHTPTLTLAAAWSEVMRRSVATAARLVSGENSPGWTWFVSGSVPRGEALRGGTRLDAERCSPAASRAARPSPVRMSKR